MSTSETERDYVALVHIRAVLQSRSDMQCAAVLDNPAWVNEIIAAIESRAIPIISVRARNAGDEAEAGPPHILRMQVQMAIRDDPQVIMQPEMIVHGTLDLNHAATRVYYEEQQLRDQVRRGIEVVPIPFDSLHEPLLGPAMPPTGPVGNPGPVGHPGPRGIPAPEVAFAWHDHFSAIRLELGIDDTETRQAAIIPRLLLMQRAYLALTEENTALRVAAQNRPWSARQIEPDQRVIELDPEPEV